MDTSELERVGFVVGATHEERADLAAAFRVEQLPVGTALAIEGDDPTKFYVLLDGHVTVHRDGKHLRDLGPGDSFGELGVVGLTPRTATVIATTPIRVAVAMGWDLRERLDRNEALKDHLAQTITDRRDA
jgi:CRP/FNR family transcriptional regulator, cyclic AMP receptor protein